MVFLVEGKLEKEHNEILYNSEKKFLQLALFQVLVTMKWVKGSGFVVLNGILTLVSYLIPKSSL